VTRRPIPALEGDPKPTLKQRAAEVAANKPSALTALLAELVGIDPMPRHHIPDGCTLLLAGGTMPGGSWSPEWVEAKAAEIRGRVLDVLRAHPEALRELRGEATEPTLATTLLDRIAKSLAEVERAPGSWGSPEALEFQVLMLVEMRAAILAWPEHVDTRHAFEVFVAREFGEPTNWMLYAALESKGRADELPRLLAKFADEALRELGEAEAGGQK
jgi:hypothetical protein